MIVPVHVGGVARFVTAVLNPRLLMVYALLGGSVARAWRRRRWRARFEERRRGRPGAGRGPGAEGER